MSWQDSASCKGMDTNIFFDIYEENLEVRSTVDAICFSCPVKGECFEDAVRLESWGVHAGIYLEDGKPSQEFNDHKDSQTWHDTWLGLTMEISK